MISQIAAVLINFIPILIAIILHEVAHGYTAYKLGDDTAQKAGRLSLNPLKHIEPFGSIVLPALLYYSGVGFIFGWAKPVPVSFSKLKADRDRLLVASAGILANICLALLSAGLLHAADYISHPLAHGLFSMFMVNMVVYNIVLAIFNLLPIPPLDGSKILFGRIHTIWVQRYINSNQAGLIAIIVLIFVLPAVGQLLHINLNIFGWYMINVSKFFISLLV